MNYAAVEEQPVATRDPAMTPIISAVNDFVVKFANVNGSGSASANELFARSILRMGVPLVSRNIFPSNCQGMPTWYEVRISGEGWLGRRGGVDLMVAMNPQTWDKDVESIDPGGYLFYDSIKLLGRHKLRDDIHLIGVPVTPISNAACTDPRQRQLFKNIIYVGALAALLDIDLAIFEDLLSQQFESKQKLIAANVQALWLGADYVRTLLPDACKLKVMKSDKVGDRIFIQGNDAAGLGAVYGGATVCAWYPITPSTSLPESFTANAKRFRIDPMTGENNYAVVQAEDEIAAIGMVIGAGWNGARAFTATSGPGDAHAAGRYSFMRLCESWRHQAYFALPRRSTRKFRVCGCVLRHCRAATDAGVRDDGPRHRHE